VDQDLPESSGHHVAGGAGASVTNVGHFVHPLELTADSVVNTLWSPPVPLDLVIPVRLVPGELLHPLLDNLWP